MPPDLRTTYELGNHNQTTTWLECITFYKISPHATRRCCISNRSACPTAGVPIHAGVVSADGVFDREQIKREGRTVFFNNNGIHPGEPEGIDACMAIVRDLCTQPERLAALGSTVLLFIPIYNVDGSLNRANTSRVNQDGPEQFGFRGNSRHLDLNRDFIKCDSLNAQVFNRLLTSWDPDVMVDTHTSNGADYPYTMTLIHTQTDKLGNGLGPFLQDTMLPHIFAADGKRRLAHLPLREPRQGQPRSRHRRIPRSAAFLDRFCGLAPRHRFHAGNAHAQALCRPLRFHARPARHHDGVHRRTWRTDQAIARAGQGGGPHASRVADPLEP